VKIKLAGSEVDMRLEGAEVDTIEEIDGRSVERSLRIEFVPGQEIGYGKKRKIFGTSGDNTVISRNDSADVTYYGGDGSDVIDPQDGRWVIYPGKGQNTIRGHDTPGGFKSRKVIIEKPEDSSMEASQTVILNFRSARDSRDFSHDIIVFGFPTRSLVPDDVQRKVDEAAETALREMNGSPVVESKQKSGRGVGEVCRQVYEKVMAMDELREGDIVQIQCPLARNALADQAKTEVARAPADMNAPDESASKEFLLAIKNQEKTALLIQLAPSALKMAQNNIENVSALPAQFNCARLASTPEPTSPEQSGLVGLADPAWTLPEGEPLPTT
jgi:hypothetical protein